MWKDQPTWEETLTLQEQLSEIEVQLGQLDNNNRGDLAEISRLTTLQNELTNQLALEARVQVQEEKVESISLPYDFSEIFDDPRANEMIVELIKEYQRAAYSEHNAELNELVADHRAQVVALNNKNDEVSAAYEYGKKAYTELERQNGQLILERDDALAKRDAAVAEKEGIELLLTEKQAQIDKLRDEIAIGAVAAVNVTNISPTDRLALLVQESKNAKVKSALDIALENAAPFRGKVISDGQVVANLDAPQVTPFPIIDQTGDTSNQLVTGPAESVPADDQVTFPEEAVSTLSTGLAEGVSSEVGESGKTLEERVKALELHVFGA